MYKHLLSIVLLVCAAVFSTVKIKAQEIALEKEADFSGVETIVVNSDFCALSILKAEGANVHYKAVIKAEKNPSEYDINTSNVSGKLTIDVKKPGQWSSHWGELTLFVPEGVALEVSSLSGKISLKDIVVNDVIINSKSGNVDFNNVNGSINVNTPAGRIVADNCKGNFKMKSKTGVVTVTNFDGVANITSDNGIITVKDSKGQITVFGGEGEQEYEKIDGDLSLKSTTGDMKISLCNGTIKTRTFGANQKLFQCEGVFEVQSSKGNVIGNRIKFTGSSSFTTTEGSIKVQTGTKSNVRYELSSDNSMLRAMEKSKKKNLKIGKGDIIITGTSTSGAQSFY